MQQNTKTPDVPIKKPSTGSSKTGAILSILALAFSAIGSALVNSKYKSAETVTTAADKAGEAVASGTWRVLATIFSMPLLIAGICLGGLAILFTLIKLRKVKATGWVVSVIWIAIGAWAIQLGIAAFQVISAN
jgi:hypothetical protein